jgi:hypothetical protein
MPAGAPSQEAAINHATPAPAADHSSSTEAAAGDAELWAPEIAGAKVLTAPAGVDFGRLMEMVGELQTGLKELQIDLQEPQLQQL